MIQAPARIDRDHNRYFKVGPATLLLTLSLLFPAAAQAQIGVEDIIGTRTLGLGASVDLKLSRLGDQIIGSAIASATVRDVQPVLDTVLPTINQKLACKQGAWGTGNLSSLRLTGSTARPDGLAVTASGRIYDCLTEFITVDVDLEVPIFVDVRGNSVRVRADTINVRSFNSLPLSSSMTRRVSSVLSPHVTPTVEKLNAMINRQLNGPALREHIRAYKLKIKEVRLANAGGDLVLTVNLDGNTKAAVINSWFASTPEF